MPLNEQFDETGGYDEEPKPPLDKNQKIAAAGLAVFAVLIIVLWTAQLKNNIYGPFNAKTSGNQLAGGQTGNGDVALKNKDTDGDGLSDYDELNIYHTSPYLADTDSDGIPDGVEVKNSTDPNCPQGRTCAGGTSIVEQGGSTDNTASSTFNSLLNQFGATNPSAGQASLNSDQVNALKNIDAASLRQLLIEKGLPKETLDKISDADLLKSYQEILSTGQ